MSKIISILILSLLLPQVSFAIEGLTLLTHSTGELKHDKKKADATPSAAHWNFVSASSEKKCTYYSPNKDGLGFDNNSRCFGHAVLSIRWYQYMVNPLKKRWWKSITPQEFKDLWGGRMDLAPNYNLTPDNIDNDRLYAFSVWKEKGKPNDARAKLALAKIAGRIYKKQRSDETYDDAKGFSTALWNHINRYDTPLELGYRRSGGGHSVTAYKVEKGTALLHGERRENVYKIYFWDPNEPSGQSNSYGTDAGYEKDMYFIVFDDQNFVGMSEQLEGDYYKYVRKSGNEWRIPSDNVELSTYMKEDPTKDFRVPEMKHGWMWRDYVGYGGISDEEAREIAGLKKEQ